MFVIVFLLGAGKLNIHRSCLEYDHGGDRKSAAHLKQV